MGLRSSLCLSDSGEASAFNHPYPVDKSLAYGLTSDVKGHAEVYRYIGKLMPPQLTMYYPRLF